MNIRRGFVVSRSGIERNECSHLYYGRQRAFFLPGFFFFLVLSPRVNFPMGLPGDWSELGISQVHRSGSRRDSSEADATDKIDQGWVQVAFPCPWGVKHGVREGVKQREDARRRRRWAKSARIVNRRDFIGPLYCLHASPLRFSTRCSTLPPAAGGFSLFPCPLFQQRFASRNVLRLPRNDFYETIARRLSGNCNVELRGITSFATLCRMFSSKYRQRKSIGGGGTRMWINLKGNDRTKLILKCIDVYSRFNSAALDERII